MKKISRHLRLGGATLLAAVLAAALGACAGMDPDGPPRKETVFAVTAGTELIKFNAGQPGRILERKPVTGLDAGDKLIGIDYRVARGVLYALSLRGQLFTLDTATGALKPVGVPLTIGLTGNAFGFDFNPAADRIRVVNDIGLNLRVHPDTGAAVDTNPNLIGTQPDADLSYATGDANAGRSPRVVAAAYTYNKQDDKLTTNYAIDIRLGVLATQGSVEGTTPVVSPNTGQLRTVGSLGLGALADASFDIADVSGAAFAALRTHADARTRLYLVDLKTGRAQNLGTVGDGSAVVGIAIEP